MLLVKIKGPRPASASCGETELRGARNKMEIDQKNAYNFEQQSGGHKCQSPELKFLGRIVLHHPLNTRRRRRGMIFLRKMCRLIHKETANENQREPRSKRCAP